MNNIEQTISIVTKQIDLAMNDGIRLAVRQARSMAEDQVVIPEMSARDALLLLADILEAPLKDGT